MKTTVKNDSKIKKIYRIVIVILIIACFTATIALPAIAAGDAYLTSEPSVKVNEVDITFTKILDTICEAIFATAESFIICFIIWITIKIIKLVHFFKLFSIHNETKRTNESLEKIIAIQQEQLDFLMGKKKDDEVTIKISKEQLDNLLGKKNENQ